MKGIHELIALLNQILKSEISDRSKLINEFQKEIWDSGSVGDTHLDEILSEIAYDLDFYEPNEEWQKEFLSYYGNEKLTELLNSRLSLLQRFLKGEQ